MSRGFCGEEIVPGFMENGTEQELGNDRRAAEKMSEEL